MFHFTYGIICRFHKFSINLYLNLYSRDESNWFSIQYAIFSWVVYLTIKNNERQRGFCLNWNCNWWNAWDLLPQQQQWQQQQRDVEDAVIWRQLAAVAQMWNYMGRQLWELGRLWRLKGGETRSHYIPHSFIRLIKRRLLLGPIICINQIWCWP